MSDREDDGVTAATDEESTEARSPSQPNAATDASDAPRDGADETMAEVLADEPLGESRRLDAKVRFQWVVGTTFGALVGAAFVGIAYQYAAVETGFGSTGSLPFGFSMTAVLVAVGAFLVFEALAVLRAVLLYRSWRYEVREDSLYLTRGVFTRVQTVAPYVRVQHIDTKRSPFERILGLSSLVVYTAGSRGADVTIPGLTDERAAELQRRLKRLAIASEEEEDAV